MSSIPRAVAAIPADYDGTTYRSKLESRWARFFDEHGVLFEYEPEGLLLGDSIYRPDFYLYECATVFEVKGITDDRDYKALVFGEQLARSHGILTLVGGFPAGRLFQVVHPTPQEVHQLRARGHARLASDVAFVRCARCGRWHYIETAMGWDCRCCGHCAGAATHSDFVYPVMPPCRH